MTSLEDQLRLALPSHLQDTAPALAQLLAAVIAGEVDQQAAQELLRGDQEFVATLRGLAGRGVEVSGTAVNFGAGAQTGDITISNVAGRDVITITVNVAAPQVQQTVTVSGGTVGNIVGQQIVQQALTPTPALFQLRAPTADFIGREQEISQLVEALTKGIVSGAAAAISGVRGMGGIGKTELAIKVAHELKDVFPDGQLLVELRGAISPVTPEDALRQVLTLLGEQPPQGEILSSLEARYRARLTRHRILVMADDAKDVAQLRPLLPPVESALLVTSRNRFGLPGMRWLDLGTLLPEEAQRLLLEICPRIGEHAAELAKLCGYLPLALRVSASSLETNDSRTVDGYIDDLRQERLKFLNDPDNPEDPTASVEASLQLSYRALEPSAQSILCQLSVLATRFDQAIIDAIVVVEGDIKTILEELRRRHLLEWDANAQLYNQHDLVREFGFSRIQNKNVVYRRAASLYNDFFHSRNPVLQARKLTPEELHSLVQMRERLRALLGLNRRDPF